LNVAEASTAVPEHPAKIDAALLKVASVVLLVGIMSTVNITAVSVALPALSDEFNASVAMVVWTMTAYALALATVIPVSGWAADRYGARRVYLIALTLFVAGSVLCASADSLGRLVGSRVVQGVGGGMLIPLGMAINARAAGPKRLGRLMAILGAPLLLGPILGPVLGGWIIDLASWRWIFLINLPLGLIAVAAAYKNLPRDRPRASEPLDLVGVLLLSPGLALSLFSISSIAGGHGGGSLGFRFWLLAAIGIALIVAFVCHSFRPVHPLLDLRLFRNRQLTVATITMFVLVMASVGAALLVPSYAHHVRGASALAAGLLIAPLGLGTMLTMPLAGVLADRVPVGRTVPIGILLMGGGLSAFTQLETGPSYAHLGCALFVLGMGQGLAMMPTTASAMKTLSHHEAARGSTLISIVQQVGGSIGIAGMSVILTTRLTSSPGAPDGVSPSMSSSISEAQIAASAYSTTFTVALLIVLLTLIPAAFLPRNSPDSEVALLAHRRQRS
jgi:EmrB/QacA subfamily drug resistance transporter